MYAVVPLFICLEHALQLKLSLHGVVRRVLQHIELVVVGVAVVGLEVDVPFVAYSVQLW